MICYPWVDAASTFVHIFFFLIESKKFMLKLNEIFFVICDLFDCKMPVFMLHLHLFKSSRSVAAFRLLFSTDRINAS